MAIPKWRKKPKAVTIETLRTLAARHGQNVVVLFTWSHKDCKYHFVTVGSDKECADAAVRLRDAAAKNLGIPALGFDRDLRHEHPNVKLTKNQLFFLLYVLGRVFAGIKKFPKNKRDFVLKYHDELLPLLGEAYEKT